MTQKDLAKVLNLSEKAVNLKLNGGNEFKITELVKIADFFNVNINIFFNK